jgi:hypothetical protein
LEWVWGVLGHYGCFVESFSMKFDNHTVEFNAEINLRTAKKFKINQTSPNSWQLHTYLFLVD